MSADGVAAVVSGVDLALVSWMDGPVVDLSSISVATGQSRREQPNHHQRIGRCLCAKDGVASAAPNSNSNGATATTETTTTATKTVTVVTPSSGHDGSSSASSAATLPLLKPTLKKPRPASSYSATPSKTLSIDRRNHMVPHLVPQVVEVAGPFHRSKQQQTGQVSRTNSAEGAGRTAAGGNNKLNRSSNSICNSVGSRNQAQSAGESVPATKPILSRKNWNNTVDVSGSARHQPSCLRRYGSQQSCKSATTLRSYVASTSSNSRGNKNIPLFSVSFNRNDVPFGLIHSINSGITKRKVPLFSRPILKGTAECRVGSCPFRGLGLSSIYLTRSKKEREKRIREEKGGIEMPSHRSSLHPPHLSIGHFVLLRGGRRRSRSTTKNNNPVVEVGVQETLDSISVGERGGRAGV